MKQVLFIFLVFLGINSYCQTGKIALVIGNGNYNNDTLDYAVNNAKDFSSSLEKLGFRVLTFTNLDQNEMKRAIDDFGNELYNQKLGLFYFSGYSVQAKGINYLVPANTDPATENDVEFNCVDAGRVLAKMEDAGTEINLVILDASADNKIDRKWTKDIHSRGLAFLDAPAGTLIAYSSLPGKTSVENNERNSVYTAAIIELMNKPNMDIEDMFKQVRTRVKQKTSNMQIPWESSSLEKDFCFRYDENYGDNSVSGKEENKTVGIPNREFHRVFTDERDGRVYEWVNIGGQIWMTENLNYETEQGSWCYANQERNCDIFGRLYNFEAAKKACPGGWHLPSDEEWKMLEIHVGMTRTQSDVRGWQRGTIEGGKLKSTDPDLWEEPNNGATDEFGFAGIAGGYRDETGIYDAMYKWGFYWSSTEHTNMCAWSRVLFNDMTYIERMNIMDSYGQSIRCIKDESVEEPE